MLQKINYSDYMKEMTGSPLNNLLRPYGRVVAETRHGYPARLYIVGQTHRGKNGYSPLMPRIQAEDFKIFERLHEMESIDLFLAEGLSQGVDYSHRQWRRTTLLRENFPDLSYSESEIAHLMVLSGLGLFDTLDAQDLIVARFGVPLEGFEVPENQREYLRIGFENIEKKRAVKSEHFAAHIYFQQKRSGDMILNGGEIMRKRSSSKAAGFIGMLHILEITRFLSQGRIEIPKLGSENYNLLAISEELPPLDFTVIMPEGRANLLNEKWYQWM